MSGVAKKKSDQSFYWLGKELSPHKYITVYFCPHLHSSVYCICVFTTHCVSYFCTVSVCMCIRISCVYLSHSLSFKIFCSGLNNPSIGVGNIFSISDSLWCLNSSLRCLLSTSCSMKSTITALLKTTMQLRLACKEQTRSSGDNLPIIFCRHSCLFLGLLPSLLSFSSHHHPVANTYHCLLSCISWGNDALYTQIIAKGY